MCIPSQIICDSDPKILDAFDIFEDVPSRVYEAWIFFPVSLLFASYRIWQVELHTPFPCPASQLIYIFMKFQCVLFILNFSEANTVIRKESYFWINVCWDIINVQRKQQGTKDSTLWDTRQNRGPIRFCTVYNNSLSSVAQKRIYSRLKCRDCLFDKKFKNPGNTLWQYLLLFQIYMFNSF